MDSDWESTFEFVSETGQIKKRNTRTTDINDVKSLHPVKQAENKTDFTSYTEKRRRISRRENMAIELVAILCFVSTLMFICVSDFVDIKKLQKANQAKMENPAFNYEVTEENFDLKLKQFMEEIEKSGRTENPMRRNMKSSLFYILSEKVPIELAFRREWIADPTFYKAVDAFVRGMEWENTFEEDLFIHGVPNFDHIFDSEEMTLKTSLNGENYNQKFLNLGRKEMIGKHHSMEYFISGKTLIRLEKKDGKEVSRTEYFIKHGDLHVFDKRGDLECTRVYFAPVIDSVMVSKVRQYLQQ